MSARRLVSLRRTIDPARRAAYDQGWAEVQRAATERGAHAWRFASATTAGEFIEFLEFASGADPRAAGELRRALQRLETECGAAEVEEWTQL